MISNPLSLLPSIPYPPPGSRVGWWAPATSTINWCEEDYYATIYSAEIINTLTNILFMYLSAKGIHNCLKHGHDSVFIVAYVGYLLTGTGSFLFHATLKYPMQLVDELSMIYTTCLMCYATFSHARSLLSRSLLGIFLSLLCIFITLYYHYLQDPAFHEAVYGILTVVVVVRAVYVMEVNLRPRFRSRSEDGSGIGKVDSEDRKKERQREDAKNREILTQMWTMIRYGLSAFLLGFLLWTVDIQYCPTLRQWRRSIGMPWGFFLELHGWWHVLTGTGGYFYIVWCTWLRHCLNQRQEEFGLHWPNLCTMPVIINSNQSEQNQKQKRKPEQGPEKRQKEAEVKVDDNSSSQSKVDSKSNTGGGNNGSVRAKKEL